MSLSKCLQSSFSVCTYVRGETMARFLTVHICRHVCSTHLSMLNCRAHKYFHGMFKTALRPPISKGNAGACDSTPWVQHTSCFDPLVCPRPRSLHIAGIAQPGLSGDARRPSIAPRALRLDGQHFSLRFPWCPCHLLPSVLLHPSITPICSA